MIFKMSSPEEDRRREAFGKSTRPKPHWRTISQKLCEQKVCKSFISATLLVGISPRNHQPYAHRGACKGMLMAIVLEIKVGRQTKEHPKTFGHGSWESGGLRICKYNVQPTGIFSFLIRYFYAYEQRWVTLYKKFSKDKQRLPRGRRGQ